MFSGINIFSDVAVYLQIENEVQFAIASGKLKAGDQLPSIRELSERVGVNPNTVAKAYRDLEVMDLVYTRRGMGVYVKKGVEKQCRERCRKRIVSRLFEVVQEGKAAGMSKQLLNQALAKTYESKAGPYAEFPKSVRVALAGSGSPRRKAAKR